MRFAVNPNLLAKAHRILADKSTLYWIIGGACAGKSTICQAISAQYGLPIYDMDAHVFDDYPGRCSAERHPALNAWFTAPDPFAWYLGLSDDDFKGFNRASNAEILDLLADDLARVALDRGLLVDGWITNPALLAQVVPVGQIVCLATTGSLSARMWEESADRGPMKEMVFQLPNPEEAWRRFLHFDALISRAILRECRKDGIRIYTRTEHTPVSALVEQVVTYFRMATFPEARSFREG